MSKHQIDLNSDMGEGFGLWQAGDGRDDEIMALISSANIATGFHAGDPNTMAHTVALAKRHGVGIGAHPGFRDLVGFGRRIIQMPPPELLNDILYQIGSLSLFAQLAQVPIQHVKPHGALYMVMAQDAVLSELFVDSIHRLNPHWHVFCMAGSATEKAAKACGQPVVRELFADRDYDNSGSIVFTRRMHRLDPTAVAAKVLHACCHGQVQTVTGDWIDLEFDSVCIHSDTPGAYDLLQATRQALDAAGIRVSHAFA